MSEAQVLPVHPLWTFADLEELPDDGYRYEIIDGSLHVSPPPTPRHQSITHLLGVHLQEAYLIT
jgi:Uma2 family endonuclease